MAKPITPRELGDVIKCTLNFLEIDLGTEELSPSVVMGRQEIIEQLQDAMERLQGINAFSCNTMSSQVAIQYPQISNDAHNDEKRNNNNNNRRSSSVLQNNTDLPEVISLRSKLKILLSYSVSELKQQADYAGFLKKHKKSSLSKWNHRFCVLRDGILLYFESGKGKGYLILGLYKLIVPPNSNGFTFELEAVDKSSAYTFQGDHKKEIDGWKQHLAQVTDQKYGKEQLVAFNAIIKEIGFSTTEISLESPSSKVTEKEPDVLITPPGSGPLQNPVTSPNPPDPPVAYPEPVAPPEPSDIYEDIPLQIAAPRQQTLQCTPQVVPPQIVPPRMPTPPVVQPLQPPGVNQFSPSSLFMGTQDFVADVNSQELSFKRGDVMYVLDNVDLDWLIAYHMNGRVGLVAKNFLKQLNELIPNIA